MLGEATREREAADEAVRQYLVMLDLIRDGALQANISVKLTHLGLDIDEAYCVDNLGRILAAAGERDIFVRLDMEGSPYTQQTLDIFYTLFDSHGNSGVVIQAMLLRSPHDIFVLNKIGARVRLCKGSYREPSDLALQRMPNIRGAFLSMAEQLLRDGRFPRFRDARRLPDRWRDTVRRAIGGPAGPVRVPDALRLASQVPEGDARKGFRHADLRALRYGMDALLLPEAQGTQGERMVRPAEPGPKLRPVPRNDTCPPSCGITRPLRLFPLYNH